MAHEVEALLYAGETPWHRIGVPITEEQSGDLDFVKSLPALNWDVEARPLYLGDGRTATTRAIVRKTDDRVLGEVGDDYTIVQNSEALEWFRPFVQSKDAAIEVAGSLRGGSRIFVLARLIADPKAILPGDEVVPYLLLANSHDASLRLHVGFTPIRVVCANTLRAARADGRSKLLQLRHTSGVKVALETVQKTVDLAHREFAATIEQYKKLAATKCTDGTLEKYVRLVFNPNEAANDNADEAAKAAKEENVGSRVLPDVRRLFDSGVGTSIPGVRGSLWGALNAVSEYVQYERGTDPERRLNETWFGSGKNLNDRALKIGLQLAA